MPTVRISNRFDVAFDDGNALLGEGGMGSVFRGLDVTTGEAVAVKIIKSDQAARDPDAVNRFEREGEALRKLNHPNIVKMLAAERYNQSPCLVMEYVSGGSLRDLLDEQPRLSIQRVLYIALDLADALTRAHRLHILHRDIKPGNVLLAADGTPRLTDFGMARFDREPHITQEGVIVGTMAYLAPEAFQGEEPDERTDIWAFGIMLYEMLAGERPFPQTQFSALIQAILTHPLPDLEVIRPDAPTALIDLIYRMLNKDRQARIPSARLIGAELEAILRGTSTNLQPVVRVEDSTGRFDLATTEFPPVDTAPRVPNNLPIQPTPFVGRQQELADLAELLKKGARLLTLAGPGGIGKSRLAQALATQQMADFTDGVYFIPLAPLESADYVIATIAEHLGMTTFGGDPRVDLVNYLREKRMLIVLDNFEHVMPAAAVIADILAAAAEIRLIVTSRERLRLREEQAYDVGGLLLPDTRGLSPDLLAELPAVKLFLQSARRVLPDFTAEKQQDCEAVIAILQAVGGMPLGIELAAAWLESLPLHEIVTEIERSLDFLETDLRDVPERHRSVRAVFEYSWNLLTEEERAAFLKLSVFRGGFEREAAQEVAGASLRTLTTLVNKSLLTRSPEGRYHIHKMLRQYAEERFAGDTQAKVATYHAHAQYYSIFASRLQVPLNSPRERTAIETFDLELENIRLMWRMALQYGHYHMLDIAQDAMLLFYLGRSLLQEGYELFKAVGDAMQKDGYEDATYWRARNRQAYLGMRINKYKETERISKHVLEFFADAPASGENGIAHNNLSYVYMIRGDYDASIYHAQQPLRYTVREDDPLVWYVSMGNLGYAHYLTGDLKRAREIYEEIDHNLGDGHYSPSGAAYMKNNLGEILREMGEIRQAKELFQQAHENFASIKHMRGMAFTLLNLGGIEYMQGNYAQARTHYQRAYDLNREVGDQWGLAHSLSSLGNLAAAAGDHVLAAQKYDASLNIRREIGDRRGMADSISDLAVCEVNTKRYTRALTLLEEALVIRREIGDRQGEGMALALAGIAGVLHGEQQQSHENLLAAVQIGEELGARNVLTQAYSGLGELELMANHAEVAETWFKRALGLYSREDGDLAMTLWALTGIARIRLAQGQDITALQLVALVLRYPRTYIAIIETLVGAMLDDLTSRLQPQKVEQTMNFSKTLEMSQVISDLLSEA